MDYVAHRADVEVTFMLPNQQVNKSSEVEAVRGCVLVVDDDDAIRESVRDVLTDEGYRVLSAENGAVALEAVQAHAADLRVVLLDLMMPVMSGWELLEVLQAHERYSRIPVVVVSAMSAPGTRGHIQKPIDVDHLLATVAKFFCCCHGTPD
jgi:CheY-like chemotaxis protein